MRSIEEYEAEARAARPAPCSVIVADPPWSFSDRLPGKGRGAAKHYPCMTVSEIQRFPLPALADDCVLFLWCVSAMPEEALSVVRAWGFKPGKGELIWLKSKAPPKPQIGMGRILRSAHERCLIATRGRMPPAVRNVPSWFFAPRQEHSRKPDAFYSIVEALYPHGERGSHVELFARQRRPMWRQFGSAMERAHP